MRVLKGVVAFAIVFCLLTATVVCAAVVGDEAEAVDTGNMLSSETENESAGADTNTTPPTEADSDENNDQSLSGDMGIAPRCDSDIAHEGAQEFTARLTAPAKTNPYYYSDKNIFYKNGWGMPNCTAYAWGRAYEILKKEPQLCIYDAYQWFDYNKNNKIYAYGQTPKLGAIACYKYIGYSSGHVAVVEKIVGDTVYYSNSAWSGQEFYVNSSPIDSPEDALYNSQFLGYIYIGEFYSGEDSAQAYRITSDNGVNMRSGAGTSYGIVGAIPYNKTVLVLKTAKANGYNWGYTTYNGVSGWFVTDFAELIEEDKPAEPPEPSEPVEPDEPEEPTPIIGDVDLDSKVTVMDSTLIQMFVAEMFTLSDEQQALCDVDNDGKISVMDSTKIRLYLAGLE